MQVERLGVYTPEELKEMEAEISAGSVPGEKVADIQERAARVLDKRRLTRDVAERDRRA